MLCAATVRASDFDYDLPPELIAQTPALERDQSRLLVLQRPECRVSHGKFRDVVTLLKPGDLLVLNDSKVIPARLRAVKADTGGELELLLLQEVAANSWWTMMRPAKRAQPGTRIELYTRQKTLSGVRGIVVETNEEGHRRVTFSGSENIFNVLDELGEVPLPPYIPRQAFSDLPEDKERYQTVYARVPGSVAAPTAGLHFTPSVLQALQARGVGICQVTLHVGPGTFAPVKAEDISGHVMHSERYELGLQAAHQILECRARGGRVVAAGTTSLRVLEGVAEQLNGEIREHRGSTRIFIHPPHQFRTVDGLITNFHLPRSTLLMLVSAFCSPGKTDGIEMLLRAYEEAIRSRYRFFSYGDAMIIL